MYSSWCGISVHLSSLRGYDIRIRKRDLVNLFTSAVTPRLGRWAIKMVDAPDFATFRQTPELRSSLTKTIRFRAKQSTFDIANKIKEAALMAQK